MPKPVAAACPKPREADLAVRYGPNLSRIRRHRGVECTRCGRKGRYSVRKLIEKYGRKANMMKWKQQLNGDCPRRDAPQLQERCDLLCPDLPKVL